MSRIPFAAIIAGILIVISYFTSKIYSLGFKFDTVATRITFFVFLIIPVLFLGSVLLTRTATSIGSTLYKEIQILTGVGFYIFLGAIILAICLIGTQASGVALPVGVAWTILGLSLALAALGFVQARFITVAHYTVTLADAPDSWQNKTAVLVSDTHFGLVNYKNFSDSVIDHIIALHPDFVLHAGDFYDGPSINTAPITASWKRLTAVVPVFMTPGNHEQYGNYIAFLDSIRDADITVLDDKKAMFDGVQIAGITYRSGKDPIAAKTALDALKLDPHTASILINHPPTSLAAAQSEGVDLQVSGHTHNGQFWPLTYLIRKIFGPYYHGHATYQDMNVITSSGIGTFGPPFRLFNRPELVVITFQK